ncbi:hypothetical protein DN442_08840, partial [Lactobacillus reuteri]|nr:hypothetical protein [Limosilactobacillus reuteri]
SFDVWVFKSLPQMAFYFSNLILQTAIFNKFQTEKTRNDLFDLDFTINTMVKLNSNMCSMARYYM